MKPEIKMNTERIKSVRSSTVLCLLAAVCFAGCAAAPHQDSSQSLQHEQGHADTEDSKILENEVALRESGDLNKTCTFEVPEDGIIVVFSQSGKTLDKARRIEEITGYELIRLEPEEPYSTEDLDYNNKESRTRQEFDRGKVYIPYSTDVSPVEEARILLVGFPIWYGQEPRIIDSFLQDLDLNGKVVIPFCTSESTGIDESQKRIEDLTGQQAVVKGGKRIRNNDTRADLESWLSQTLEAS